MRKINCRIKFESQKFYTISVWKIEEAMKIAEQMKKRTSFASLFPRPG